MMVDTQKLLNLFDTAAQAHGWASDQGTRAQAQTALANYQRARGDLEQALDAQAAEIAEAKVQVEHLDRQNNALRDVLRSLADIDLAGPMPNDFAWFVLRARSALQEGSHG